MVGIPLAEPGYHVVEIESQRLGESLLDKRAPMYVRTGVLVTNLGVHFKLGRENSVVWVTTLDRGKPVADADVAVNDCRGKPLWTGRTDAQGPGAWSPRALDARAAERLPGRQRLLRHRAQGRRRKAGATDIAFVFSDWQKGIEPWRFNVPTSRGARARPARPHGVRPHAAARRRDGVDEALRPHARPQPASACRAADRLPTRVKIVHQGSGQEFAQPLQWSGRRAQRARRPGRSRRPPSSASTRSCSSATRRCSAPAATRTASAQRSWASGSFRVEEFRLPLVDAPHARAEGGAGRADERAVDVQLQLLLRRRRWRGAPLRAVGPAARAQRRAFAGYDDFSFEPPRDPKQAEQDGERATRRATPPARDGKLRRRQAAAHAPTATAPPASPSKDLPPIDARRASSSPRSPSTTRTARCRPSRTRIDLWPSAVVLGMQAPARGPAAAARSKFQALALDTAGKPIKGQSVAVRGRVSQIITTRKRMVGGFYAYDNRTEVKDLGTLCSGNTDDRGLLLCEAELDAAGQVELIAEREGRRPATRPGRQHASGSRKQGELWFAQDNDDRIDVLPEKKRYEPGETARLQVRMPFREATALVAVEREGVIDDAGGARCAATTRRSS